MVLGKWSLTVPDDEKNRYDQPSRYKDAKPSAAEPVKPGVGTAGGSPNALVPVPSVPAWQARPVPEVAIFHARFGLGGGNRRKATRLVNDIGIATDVLNANTQFTKAAEALEIARNVAESAHARREFLPLRMTQERLGLEQQLFKATSDVEAAREEVQEQRVDRERHRQLATEDYEIAKLKKKAQKLEASARIAAAAAQLANAPLLGAARSESELFQAKEEAFRHQADAESERRRWNEERRKRGEVVPPEEKDTMPPTLARHYATEHEVKENLNAAALRAQAIREQAVREGRDISPDEIEELDILENAAIAAEQSIRRGGASDI